MRLQLHSVFFSLQTAYVGDQLNLGGGQLDNPKVQNGR